MRDLVRLLRQRLVVEVARGIGIEREVELVLPAELESRTADRVVAQFRAGMALGEIRRVRCDAVGDDTNLHVVAVGETEMFLRSDVAEHRGAEPADHRGTDRRRNVIIAGCDVGGQRAKRVERRLAAFAKLLVHVDLDLVHRHVAGALDHHLAALVPGHLGQFAQRLQFGELRRVVGIGLRAGPSPSPSENDTSYLRMMSQISSKRS